MKLALLLSILSAAYAESRPDFFEDEKSALMLETENFWMRELQTSTGGGGQGGGGQGGGGGTPGVCGIPEADRRNQILGTLRNDVSTNVALNTAGTPQKLAVDWLLDEDTMQVCPGDKKIVQRYVMALFYFSTAGSSWLECSKNGLCSEGKNFLDGASECEWGGLACNNDNCITQIVFESNNVGGTVPYELEQLNDLEILSLEQGGVSSTIPTNIGSLDKLRILDLDFNMLTGSIPEQIYALTELEQLDLNSNKLTGTISNSIGNFQELRLLQLYENLMTGTIPNSLGSLDNLVIAEFFNNTFTGVMPQSVCDNRSPPDGNGAITGLTSDCFAAPIAQIVCSCCTACAVF